MLEVLPNNALRDWRIDRARFWIKIKKFSFSYKMWYGYAFYAVVTQSLNGYKVLHGLSSVIMDHYARDLLLS